MKAKLKNNRKTTNGRKKQQVMSAPSKVLIGSYITKKGIKLSQDKNITLAEMAKYTKNRYKVNSESVVIKEITHK